MLIVAFFFGQVQHLKELDKLVIILYEAESPTLTGDIKMKFYSSNPVSCYKTTNRNLSQY